MRNLALAKMKTKMKTKQSNTKQTKPVHDHSGPTTFNYKGFTWQDSWGPICPLHPRHGAQSVHYNLWRELQSKAQDPLTGHVSMNICIPRLGASIWRFLYQGNTKIIFSPLRFSTQYFSIPSPCLSPSSQTKSPQVFSLVLFVCLFFPGFL